MMYKMGISKHSNKATLVNINSNQPLYYPFTFSVNKCAGSCNTTGDHMLKYVFQRKYKNKCKSI